MSVTPSLSDTIKVKRIGESVHRAMPLPTYQGTEFVKGEVYEVGRDDAGHLLSGEGFEIHKDEDVVPVPDEKKSAPKEASASSKSKSDLPVVEPTGNGAAS